MTSAETALNSVADRVEFCSEGNLGGLTPDLEAFRYLKAKYQKPVYVMIRPKGGDFFYSENEFEVMKKSLKAFYDAGADGFVFGILDSNSQVDKPRCKELLDLAGGRPCTFHRAIDHTADVMESVRTLVELGFKTVLTSGGKNSAVEGAGTLRNLVERYSAEIDILIGGGVRSHNISQLKIDTGGTHFHSSAI